MTIEKIVDYVLHTPHNTNRAILITMLKDLIRTSGGSTDPKVFIYEGGIETAAGLSIRPEYIYDGGVEA